MSFRTALISVAPPLKKAWCAHKERRLRVMRATFVAQFGLVVRNGPFKGLRYIGESSGSALLPKLLGSYEAALHPVLNELMTNQYDNIIDIGCAEGYYAVGLAHRCPGTPVVAFDSNRAAQEMCERLANLNGVSQQITVRGACSPEALAEAIEDRSLIVCDCEGDEVRLLDPVLLPGLKRCDLLVELHPFIDSDIPNLIAERFRETHSTGLIREDSRGLSLSELKAFKWFDRPLATYEERFGAEGLWAVLRSRSRN